MEIKPSSEVGWILWHLKAGGRIVGVTADCWKVQLGRDFVYVPLPDGWVAP